jgi:hypothetical protein
VLRGINIKHTRSRKLLKVNWIFGDRRQEYKDKNRNHTIRKIGSQNPIFDVKETKQYAMDAFKEFETKCWDEGKKGGGTEREKESRMMKGIRDPAAENGMEGQWMEETATMIRKI